MYYIEEIRPAKATELLAKCGLSLPEDLDYTAGLFDDNWQLAATASLKGDMIQGVAVEPSLQGEDLTGKLLTHIITVAKDKGQGSLHLFTKPDKTAQFEGLGFKTVAVARPYAALMEWGEGIEEYKEELRAMKKSGGKAGAIVMNCNPFTKGHKYLVEQAASKVDTLYLIVVEEEKSLFSFADRFAMAKAGTEHLKNVVLLSGGRYAVSALTFPSYFTGKADLAKAHSAMDAEIFAQQIAPTLGVSIRFVGTEPFSEVTAVYNEALKERLPKYGIEVTEIERLTDGTAAISASRVREYYGAGDMEGMAALVPVTTLNYIKERLWNK